MRHSRPLRLRRYRLTSSAVREGGDVTFKYDDASWHADGDFPAGLDERAAGTHIGLFFAWCLINGMASEELSADAGDDIAAVLARRMTGRDALFKVCDGRLVDDDLNEAGNAFARAYYAGAEGRGYGAYLSDYRATLVGTLPSDYLVEDTWENADRIGSVITRRYASFLALGQV